LSLANGSLVNGVLFLGFFVFVVLTVLSSIYARYFAPDAPGWNITMNEWFKIDSKRGPILLGIAFLLLILALVIP